MHNSLLIANSTGWRHIAAAADDDDNDGFAAKSVLFRTPREV